MPLTAALYLDIPNKCGYHIYYNFVKQFRKMSKKNEMSFY